MLLKCVGMIIIVLACGMFGFSLSYDYMERLNNLSKINKMLLLLKGEIKHNNSGIGEAIRGIASQSEDITGEFLMYVSDRFGQGKIPLKDAWNQGAEECLKNKSKLSERDLSVVKEFGINLGITDRETQINNIAKCMEVIDITIHELNEARGEKCRLYRTLGVMLGAFLAIVLV